MTVVEQYPFVLKIRDVLRAAGLRCEIGVPPAPPEGQQAPRAPYIIVIPLQGGDYLGPPFGQPESCATEIVQLTTVGRSGREAMLKADDARKVLLGRSGSNYMNSLDVAANPTMGSPAHYVRGRWSEGPAGMEADDTLFNVHERYGFFVSL